ncbi:MAG TPA: hypothetical protein VF728_04790 [Nocardioides sp.]
MTTYGVLGVAAAVVPARPSRRGRRPARRGRIVNETHRDEVTAEVIRWFDAHVRPLRAR